MTNKTTPLRPHKVLGRSGYGGNVHALTLTTGPFAGIVFTYEDVHFNEEARENEDVLKISFEYNLLEVPEDKALYDKEAFEKELGDFIVELIYYGLERDFLGFIDDQDRKDYTV